jgi:CheY-like chemotaxis protein
MEDKGHNELVLEEDDQVRGLTVEMLRSAGYRAVHAAGGSAALAMLDHGAAVDLLLTDVVMPGMDGRQLSRLAQEKRAGLRVLFMTGYTRNAIVHAGELERDVELIGKPFTVEQLVAKVDRVMGTSRAQA